MNDVRSYESCRRVSDWPVVPSSTSWCATSPRSLTECMRMPSGSAAPRACSSVSALGGIGCPDVGRRRHALRGEHRGAGRRVDLGVVVQLDDLSRLEVRRGQLGEAHHEHRPDREVRRDHRVGVRALESRSQPVELVLGEARRADDRVHAVVGTPTEVLARGLEHGEVDRDLGPGVGERVRDTQDLQTGCGDAELGEVDPDVERVDGGDEVELGIVEHRLADGLAHAATGAEHAHSGHAARLGAPILAARPLARGAVAPAQGVTTPVRCPRRWSRAPCR